MAGLSVLSETSEKWSFVAENKIFIVLHFFTFTKRIYYIPTITSCFKIAIHWRKSYNNVVPIFYATDKNPK